MCSCEHLGIFGGASAVLTPSPSRISILIILLALMLTERNWTVHYFWLDSLTVSVLVENVLRCLISAQPGARSLLVILRGYGLDIFERRFRHLDSQSGRICCNRMWFAEIEWGYTIISREFYSDLTEPQPTRRIHLIWSSGNHNSLQLIQETTREFLYKVLWVGTVIYAELLSFVVGQYNPLTRFQFSYGIQPVYFGGIILNRTWRIVLCSVRFVNTYRIVINLNWGVHASRIP